MNLNSLRELLRHCELILEILDARDIEGTRLKRAEHWSGRERLIKVANKIDLTDPKVLEEIKTNQEFLLINCKSKYQNAERKKLLTAILSKTKIRPIRVMVVGYPNVGKSTIINLLAGGKKAKAGPFAGTTKNIQWIRIHPEILLMDSPGVFPYNEFKSSLLRKGAINITQVENSMNYAYQIAEKCVKDPPLRKWLSSFFDIKVVASDHPELVLEKIAKRRNWLKKRGELNVEEASKALIRAHSQAPKFF